MLVSPEVLAQAFPELRQKLEELNINSLFDLSEWSTNGRWMRLLEMEFDHLNVDFLALITVSPTPVHRELKDERCWGKYECTQ